MIYSNLEEYRTMLSQDTNPNLYEDSVQFMKEIHYDITTRINNLAEKRNKMEEDTLALLEQAFKSLARGAASQY